METDNQPKNATATPIMEAPSPRLPPLTVSQLTNAIKLSVESTFPSVHLQGEVSNLKIQSSGHLYFSLKDAQAQIAAVLFKAEAALLKSMPKGGDQVVVKGELNVYPPKGNYQMIVRELSYVGLGELLQKLELLKVKLHQLGWFKTARKKPIPRFPQRIGVVTSPTGAVIQDILQVLTRRFSGFHLILYPVKVQGEGAAQEIAQAIAQFNRYALADVLIVGRGGGSLEDLQPFNEEVTAAAIYHSRIPIISAVGHETDHCIADYVADVRAPTPSAAAEIVIAEKSQQLAYLAALKKRLQQQVGGMIQQQRSRWQSALKHPVVAHPYKLLEGRMQRLDDCRLDVEQAMQRYLQLKRHLLTAKAQQALALQPLKRIGYFRERFEAYARALPADLRRQIVQKRQALTRQTDQLDQTWRAALAARRHASGLPQIRQRLHPRMQERLTLYRRQLDHAAQLLAAVHPRQVLAKGYAMLLNEENGQPITSVLALRAGQRIRVMLADGEAVVTIEKTLSSTATD